jgi:phage shock protein E
MRVLLLMLTAASLLATTACEQNAPPLGDITQQELSERIAGGRAPLVLDVRGPDEYTQGHLPGAVNIPHTAVSERIDELSVGSGDEIVIHCHSGKRAAIAQATLEDLGYTNMRHLEGDWAGWQEAGLPVE